MRSDLKDIFAVIATRLLMVGVAIGQFIIEAEKDFLRFCKDLIKRILTVIGVLNNDGSFCSIRLFVMWPILMSVLLYGLMTNQYLGIIIPGIIIFIYLTKKYER